MKGDSSPKSFLASLEKVASTELGDIFVDVAFFVSAIKYLKEEYWLYQRAQGLAGFVEFSRSYFDQELKPLSFFRDFFNSDSFDDLKSLNKRVLTLEKQVVELAKKRTFGEQKIFAIQALSRMSVLFRFENFWIGEKKTTRFKSGAFSLSCL